MLIRPLSVIAITGTLTLAAACSGGIESSCGNYFDALVSLENQCGGSTLFDPSERSEFLQLCDALAKAPGTGNLSGELDTCTTAIKAANCNGTGIVGSCNTRGTLADGTGCASSVQCTGGQCNNATAPSPTSEVTCGICASYVAIGSSCATGSCDPTQGSCKTNTCVAFVAQGGACGSNGQGDCQSGLTCTNATCQPYPTQGQACTFECQSPYRCVSGTCAAAVQQGGACPVGNECAASLTCNQTSHTCQPPATAQAGQPCGFVNNQEVLCASGLTCTTSTNGSTCIAPKTVGAACTVGNHECGSFLVCINGSCAVPDYTVCK
jgi:hypothetical protein